MHVERLEYRRRHSSLTITGMGAQLAVVVVVLLGSIVDFINSPGFDQTAESH